MRIFLTIVGMVGLFSVACFATVLGIMAFTPTQSCTPGSTRGVCAFGQLPMWLMLFGPWVIVAGTALATFIRSAARPRAYWPFIGVALVIGLFVVAAEIAAT